MRKLTFDYVAKFVLPIAVVALTACGGGAEKQQEPELITDEEVVMEEGVEEPSAEEIFDALRGMSLNMKAADIGIEVSADETTVFGMVMDWEIGGAIASVTAFSTGDASVYINKGGSVLGGGQHESVNTAAKKYIEFSQNWLEKATPTDETPLPGTDEVNFYFITNKGVFTGKTNMADIEGGTSEWMPLFEEANVVMARLREVEQGMR